MTGSHWRNIKLPLLGILVLLTLLLRGISASSVYFVDGPLHVAAIERGTLIIHPPGYFFFNVLGLIVSKALHCSAADALQWINIGFSVAAVAVFYLLVSRVLSNQSSAFWLSLAYACSPIVWFSAEIHSTYAAMTFFAPLLILLVEAEERFVWGCVVWALMMGFRPSDGIFVLPWMLYQSIRFSWSRRIVGAFAALMITALWWVPTAVRLGGGLLGPVSSSHAQVDSLAQGILAGDFTIHAVVNAIHTIAGTIVSWGLLMPAVVLGAVSLTPKNRVARSMVVFAAPGLLFFLLYFFSDGTYLAYAIAAGMILAGLFLEQKNTAVQRVWFATAIATSLLFMFTARPSDKPSKSRAIVDAYFVRFSVPSIKQHRARRLAELLGACHDSTIRGGCR